MGIPDFLDLDASVECWTLDAGPWTLDAGLWTPDTVVDWFRTELEPSRPQPFIFENFSRKYGW